ncbi:DNA-directed RNA polymerase i subunit rpa1 [Phtheirospermum japonicum]|uniref:DNA-directed RNA polymerase subunit n=1 Tax=Phtheirospermum japonicum TaxID=374723 RepID=A0A830C5W9_9LAMI|nr:DNA-directed RNA polymerase i subunit rpa1 [Phtheirospermum japonicum]
MGVTEIVEAVRFGFMTDEEVRKHSVVKLTNPNLLDILEKPIPGGLYDPALGPLDESSLCKSCGQSSYHCAGHCGHIDLVSPAYNPLLFSMLSNLLSRTCFHCFQFRSSRREVETCVYQLELIRKGDIGEAKKLRLRQSERNDKNMELTVPDDIVDREDSRGSHTSHSTVSSDGEYKQEDNKQAYWDSTLLTEAMSTLNEFLKKKGSKCMNCEFKNPKINKPTFGWFYVKGLPSTDIRANSIRSRNVTHSGGGENKTSSEALNASDYSGKDDSGIAEANSLATASDSTKKPSKKDAKRSKNSNQGLVDHNSSYSGPLLPSEVRDILRRLWENEAPLCKYINDIQQQQGKLSGKPGYNMYFLETILVPPIKFRPPAKGGDSVMEHPQTVLLGKVLQSNIALGNAHINNAERSKIIGRLMDLQQSINVLFDSKTATSQAQKDGTIGICQYLEKKEGVFRQKMMGKRVNFACRSVISPDPYLSVNEIGIPPYFALRLTYPERVTMWNAGKLRGAVINGPDIHPGATTYADSVGTVKLPASQKMRVAISRKLPSSRGAQSGKSNELEFEGKVVYRHLQDGDIVLVNRQPTLHKPSIMAHVVRVLKGEKTLRMHYANCSSYNADFDGDEINVHFPQDEVSRAEAYNIVNANEQYIVPTRGDTVRGLIQDHIVGAVLLTLKNTFLTRSEFSQLLYGSGVYARVPGSTPSNPSRKVSIIDSESPVESVLPSVWKPVPLWTGKQVITALLNYITRGRAPCTVENQGKVPKNYYAGNNYKNGEEDADQNAEHNLLVWKNELVRGVIDKAQFGKFGLVHTVQELYGSNSAGILLSALSRLFTLFLQTHGFTCGLDDLIILPDYDDQRKVKLEGEDVGEEVHCEFVKFKPGQIGPEELQLEVEKVISSDRESATASLDMKMKNKLTNKLTREGSQILKHLLTTGLLKPFPKNCISVMTTTGAKGSTVNFQQISAYLGQQELEGKRVPRMISGKTLPSFPPWDYTSRAGGFITDRFLTGLRPQEYYFHCMAGREGLVDTAVKTSRSGYLQRCLIKNLESLKVCYDYTVRDADGSIVQFYYGEDGVDPHQTSFLKNFKALNDNRETICQKFQNQREFNSYIEKLPEGLEEEARRFIKEARDKSEKQNGSAIEKLHKKSKGRKNEEKTTEKEQDKFIELVKQKYISSLAPSGEPVGVIAAQSIGEPSTQMTLNTFHLAGRGEMNVTLGIPRLQEILMTASETIKTPLLTCPFSEWRSKRDVVSLVSHAKKVTVADLVESMEVQLSINHHKLTRIYKLIIKLKDTEFVPLADIQDTLKSSFLRELEDAIENHVGFLSRISGIKNSTSSSRSEGSSNEADDEDESAVRTQEVSDDDDDDNDEGDDLGADAQKRKQQAVDEVDYEDGSDGEKDELSDAEQEERSDGDHLMNTESGKDEENEHTDDDDEDEASDVKNVDEVMSEAKSSGKKGKTTSKRIEMPILASSTAKNPPRAISMAFNGFSFEVEFRFNNEPHLLLAQLAQKAAKKVYIKRSGKISQCKMVEYDPDEKTVIWDDKKKPKRGDAGKQPTGGDDETSYWAVKASGIDFRSFWEMHEDLDLTRLYSNNINAVLNTYGVEAARATLIREVKHVFDIYGVKIDFRHLSLIADYMTHTGGYRPMSRHGSISESLSPFLKMSFETASKFIVEAASLGLTDNLETPSSRICLGLPVKMGTGCFELMQKLDVESK